MALVSVLHKPGEKTISMKFSLAIVIDVLRATSTIATALFNGAAKILPVANVEQALLYKDKGCLIGGERKGIKLPGFDLGNSPLEYTRERVENRDIVLTTTNGTQALLSTADIEQVYTASFLNMQSIVELVSKKEGNIVIICSGDHGNLSLEDSFCAGLLLKTLLEKKQFTLAKGAAEAIALTVEYDNDVNNAMKNSRHRKNLENLGFSPDIIYCSRLNELSVIPRYKEGYLTLTK